MPAYRPGQQYGSGGQFGFSRSPCALLQCARMGARSACRRADKIKKITHTLGRSRCTCLVFKLATVSTPSMTSLVNSLTESCVGLALTWAVSRQSAGSQQAVSRQSAGSQHTVTTSSARRQRTVSTSPAHNQRIASASLARHQHGVVTVVSYAGLARKHTCATRTTTHPPEARLAPVHARPEVGGACHQSAHSATNKSVHRLQCTWIRRCGQRCKISFTRPPPVPM